MFGVDIWTFLNLNTQSKFNFHDHATICSEVSRGEFLSHNSRLVNTFWQTWSVVELQTKIREDLTIMDKAPTRAF